MIDGVPHLVDCETSMREDGLPCGCITRDVVEAVMSSLSDHDRAVAADALRQAADDLEEQKPHISPSTDPQRRTRVIQRSTLNAAIRRLRARAEAGEPTNDLAREIARYGTSGCVPFDDREGSAND